MWSCLSGDSCIDDESVFEGWLLVTELCSGELDSGATRYHSCPVKSAKEPLRP